MRKKGFLLLFGAVLLIASCSKNKTIFEKYYKFENSTWDRFNQVLFNVPFEGEEGTYAFTLVLKPTEKYAYENLPVYVILKTPSGEERMTEVKVQVKKDGKMLGFVEGKPVLIETPLWKELIISDKGTCSVSIENMIPKIQIDGLNEIGIKVERIK